ncbi:MAG TPA: hypothetical protein VKB81_08990 [Nitrospira sp.]|nr:hypothetical protein [Nitrospira sp.]
MLHDGLEMTAEAPHALPSEGADFDPLASVIGAMRNIVDEPFLVQAFQRLPECREAHGETGEQGMARDDRLMVFPQQTEDLDLQRPELYGLARHAP